MQTGKVDKMKVNTKYELEDFCCELFEDLYEKQLVIKRSSEAIIHGTYTIQKEPFRIYIKFTKPNLDMRISFCPFCRKKIELEDL